MATKKDVLLEELNKLIGWTFDDICKLKSTSKLINDFADQIESLQEEFDEENEADKCPECGHTPDTGACYYCKAD